MEEKAIIDHIYPGLKKGIRRNLYILGPKDMAELLTMAKRVERGMRLDDEQPKARGGPNGSDMREIIDGMRDLVVSGRDRAERRVRFESPSAPRTRSRDGGPVCWTCGKNGHTARFCRFSGNRQSSRSGYFRPQQSDGRRDRPEWNNRNNDWRERRGNLARENKQLEK